MTGAGGSGLRTLNPPPWHAGSAPETFLQAKNSLTVKTSFLCMMEIATSEDIITNYNLQKYRS